MHSRAPACAAAAAALVLIVVLVAPVRAEPNSTSDEILTRYRAALDALPPLGNLVFQYTESRSGPTRALQEEHRVYRRADGEERNETIAVNGAQLIPPIVRFSDKAQWPYDVRAFAVTAGEYNVMALGTSIVGGKHAYGFSTVRTTTADFSVTGLYLDTTRYLPVRETFSATGGGCSGTGSVDFAPFGARWLPTAATVNCALEQGGATFRESIVFSDYAFPAELPPDVFGGHP